MNVLTILNQKGRDVVTIAPDCTVQNAAEILTRQKIGSVVVSAGEGRIDGILSERDIVHAIAGGGKDVLARPISDFMTSPVKTCSINDTVEVLMTVMTGRRFRHLPVEEDGRLCGIVSIGDVVKQRIAEAEMIAKAMQEYIATG